VKIKEMILINLALSGIETYNIGWMILIFHDGTTYSLFISSLSIKKQGS